MHNECVGAISMNEVTSCNWHPAMQISYAICLQGSRALRLQEGLPFGSVLDRE